MIIGLIKKIGKRYGRNTRIAPALESDLDSSRIDITVYTKSIPAPKNISKIHGIIDLYK